MDNNKDDLNYSECEDYEEDYDHNNKTEQKWDVSEDIDYGELFALFKLYTKENSVSLMENLTEEILEDFMYDN